MLTTENDRFMIFAGNSVKEYNDWGNFRGFADTLEQALHDAAEMQLQRNFEWFEITYDAEVILNQDSSMSDVLWCYHKYLNDFEPA